jgi:hypothetical protein
MARMAGRDRHDELRVVRHAVVIFSRFNVVEANGDRTLERPKGQLPRTTTPAGGAHCASAATLIRFVAILES